MELIQESDEDNPRGEIAIWGTRYFYQDGSFYRQDKKTMRFNAFDLLVAHAICIRNDVAKDYIRGGSNGRLQVIPYDPYLYMYDSKGNLFSIWSPENIHGFFLALKLQAPTVARKIREAILATARNADG